MGSYRVYFRGKCVCTFLTEARARRFVNQCHEFDFPVSLFKRYMNGVRVNLMHLGV